jgi:hypothetical protein
LKEAFPKIIPVNRPDYAFKGIPDPDWVAGFTSGDGSFHLIIRDPNTNKGKGSVSMRFSIKLDIREIEVIKGLVTFFKLNGTEVAEKEARVKNFHASEKEGYASLQFSNLSDIVNTIIPFFQKYPILGVKSLDYADFKKVAIVIQSKNHLNPEGLLQIIEIKSNMNQNRTK